MSPKRVATARTMFCFQYKLLWENLPGLNSSCKSWVSSIPCIEVTKAQIARCDHLLFPKFLFSRNGGLNSTKSLNNCTWMNYDTEWRRINNKLKLCAIRLRQNFAACAFDWLPYCHRNKCSRGRTMESSDMTGANCTQIPSYLLNYVQNDNQLNRNTHSDTEHQTET